MREILFRGKRIDNGEWVEGAYYHQTEFYGDSFDGHYIITTTDELEDNMMDVCRVIPETVGQYTGLTDKNGTKIFEGDIVKWSWDTVFQVVYDDCYLGFIAKEKTGYHICLDNYGLNKIEVIGNVHDNPELLGGENNAKETSL
jgi:uncharacterized phage protein (TIGR01671 family)